MAAPKFPRSTATLTTDQRAILSRMIGVYGFESTCAMLRTSDSTLRGLRSPDGRATVATVERIAAELARWDALQTCPTCGRHTG